MSGFREYLWESLKNKFFRREYVAENVRVGIASQIKAMRNARKLSQTDLAKMTGKAQSAIARFEDPDYGKYSVQSLLEIADAFDVWLSVEFIPFSKGLSRTANRSAFALNAVSFSDDSASLASLKVAETNKSPVIISFSEPISPELLAFPTNHMCVWNQVGRGLPYGFTSKSLGELRNRVWLGETGSISRTNSRAIISQTAV